MKLSKAAVGRLLRDQDYINKGKTPTTRKVRRVTRKGMRAGFGVVRIVTAAVAIVASAPFLGLAYLGDMLEGASPVMAPLKRTKKVRKAKAVRA